MLEARLISRPIAGPICPSLASLPDVTSTTPDEPKGLLTTGTSFWMDERRIAPGPVAKSPVQGWPAPGTHSATRPAARQRATAHQVTNVKTPPPTREVRVGKLKTSGDVEQQAAAAPTSNAGLVHAHTRVLHHKHDTRRTKRATNDGHVFLDG